METDTADENGVQTNLLLEDLAGTLADELTLQSDLFNGSVFYVMIITLTSSFISSTNRIGQF